MLCGPITEKATDSFPSNSRFKGQHSTLPRDKEHKKIGSLSPTEHWTMLLSLDGPVSRVAWTTKTYMTKKTEPKYYFNDIVMISTENLE